MRVGVSLRGVPSKRGCAKPQCKWLGHPLHRHHRGHQKLWFGPWAHRSREPQWKAFVARYYEFRQEDVCLICDNHHAEIHSIYDRIIAEDMAATGLPLYLYSWKQGKILMSKLEAACAQWLHQVTPGIDSKLYGQTKRLLRRAHRKRAEDKAGRVVRPAKKLRKKGRRRKRG